MQVKFSLTALGLGIFCVEEKTKKSPWSFLQGLFRSFKAASSYSPTDNSAVPLPLKSLTSVFGMGTGVSFSP